MNKDTFLYMALKNLIQDLNNKKIPGIKGNLYFVNDKEGWKEPWLFEMKKMGKRKKVKKNV
jgi:hypothetical protein